MPILHLYRVRDPLLLRPPELVGVEADPASTLKVSYCRGCYFLNAYGEVAVWSADCSISFVLVAWALSSVDTAGEVEDTVPSSEDEADGSGASSLSSGVEVGEVGELESVLALGDDSPLPVAGPAPPP